MTKPYVHPKWIRTHRLSDGEEFILDDHQVDGVRWMLRHKSYLQGDEMRLGKTIQALVACAVAHQQGFASRFIVVCPTTLKANWRDEVYDKTWMQVVVLHGDPHKRENQLAEYASLSGPAFLVLNYELVAKHLDAINALNFDIAIYDECHAIKNPMAARTQATLSIVAKQYFMMTGSPMMNQVNELWSILHRIDPVRYDNYYRFAHRYCVWGGHKSKQVVGVKNEEELKEQLHKHMIRRHRKDVYPGMEKITLPPVHIEMTPEQRALYDEVKEEMLMTIPDEPDPLKIESSLTQMLRLKQICGTMATIEGYEDVSPKLSHALNEAIEMVGNKKRIVFFTQFRKVQECLVDRMQYAGLEPFVLNGHVPAMTRKPLVDAWGHAEPQPLVVMLQVGGVGLNMTAASDVRFLDKLYVPALNEQAEDRLTGRDQPEPVMVQSYLMNRSVEAYIEKILLRKGKLIKDIVESGAWKIKLIRMLKEEQLSEFEKYYTAAQVAEMFAVSKNRVSAWCLAGDIKAIKLGKVWRIPQSEVEHMASGKFQPAPRARGLAPDPATTAAEPDYSPPAREAVMTPAQPVETINDDEPVGRTVPLYDGPQIEFDDGE